MGLTAFRAVPGWRFERLPAQARHRSDELGLSIVGFMPALCTRQRGEHNVEGLTSLAQFGGRRGTIGLQRRANGEHNFK
jgi:hypothetical protein